MKKFLYAISLIGFFQPFFQIAKANEYEFFKTNSSMINGTPTIKYYGVSSSGTETLLNTWESSTSNVDYFDGGLEDARVDQYRGKIYSEVNEMVRNGNGGLDVKTTVLEYDLLDNSIETVDNISTIENYVIYPNDLENMIRYDASTGITSTGTGSLNQKTTATEQQLWGTNTNGEVAPINITNGSKLLINGRDIEQSINNVGALSAALTGLPTVPTETTLACGLGTGTHGGDFAFSGGCASKVNEKLSINYAASMTIPGQEYAGDFEDTFSARAGFVWKLGKAIKPTQISMKAKEKMEVKINSLEDKNKRLENTVSTLVSKLERLEKIALKEIKSKDLAIYKLK